MSDLITEIFFTAKRIDNGRGPLNVNASIMAEVGELAEEIEIQYGVSYKESGPDGILGEAIDSIICIVDLLYLCYPDLTNEEILAVAKTKLQKWEDKVNDHKQKV